MKWKDKENSPTLLYADGPIAIIFLFPSAKKHNPRLRASSLILLSLRSFDPFPVIQNVDD